MQKRIYSLQKELNSYSSGVKVVQVQKDYEVQIKTLEKKYYDMILRKETIKNQEKTTSQKLK